MHTKFNQETTVKIEIFFCSIELFICCKNHIFFKEIRLKFIAALPHEEKFICKRYYFYKKIYYFYSSDETHSAYGNF